MKYFLTIKSHTYAPDYEDSIEAESKEEAIKKFANCIDLDESIIRDNIEE
jgi:hypothetical protein